VIPVVCKPDLYYTMPRSTDWPLCLAKCPAAKPIPANSTRMKLDIENKYMIGEFFYNKVVFVLQQRFFKM
jgi:hypothetical protein